MPTHQELPPSPPPSPASKKRAFEVVGDIVAAIVVQAPRSGKRQRQSPRQRRTLGIDRRVDADGQECDPGWQQFHLLPCAYTELERVLRQERLWGYYCDKIRFDYDAQRSKYILRMPTAKHEVLVRLVMSELMEQKKKVAARLRANGATRLAVELDKIKDFGSPRIPLGPGLSRSPDGALVHANAAFPSIVVEVALSQPGKALARLADDYIAGSQANINCVIGLDIEYAQSPSAKSSAKKVEAAGGVSIWRVQVTEQEDGEREASCALSMADTKFRSDKGRLLNRAKSLSLTLDDFLSPTVLAESMPADLDLDLDLDAYHIDIPLPRLAELLRQAQGHDDNLQKDDNIAKRVGVTRVRKRTLTPDEELSDGREAKFRRFEDQDEQKTAEGDDFRPAPAPSADFVPRPVMTLRSTSRSAPG